MLHYGLRGSELHALLWLLGELGLGSYRVWELTDGGPDEFRGPQRREIEALSRLVLGSSLDPRARRIEVDRPVFSDAFRLRLAQARYTRWAADLLPSQFERLVDVVSFLVPRAGVIELILRDATAQQPAELARVRAALRALSRLRGRDRPRADHARDLRDVGFAHLPDGLKADVERALPGAAWTSTRLVEDGYELCGTDAEGRDVCLRLSDDGRLSVAAPPSAPAEYGEVFAPQPPASRARLPPSSSS